MKVKFLNIAFVAALTLTTGSLAWADTCSTGSFTTDSSGQSVCALTTAPSSATINGGIFDVSVGAPTGTGVFDPFLRIQQTPAEGGWNENYTNPGDVPAGSDAKSDPHTHPLTLSDLATVTVNGNTYYQFTLDLQESAGGSGELISLNNIQLFVGNNAEPSDNGCDGTNFATCIPANGDALVWNMDAGSGGDSSVTLDSTIHQGNGTSNMTLYIPTSVFGNLDGYLIFYSQFGDPPGAYDSNSSFEEWAALEGPNSTVPEPGSLLLFGSGLLSVAGFYRRKFRS